MEIITILIIICGLLVGWSIGANDAANCLGTSVGAGLIDYRKAAVIVALFAFIGAATHGQATTATVGKGIIDAAAIPLLSIVAVLLSASIFVIGLTIIGLPVSTTQAVMGSIAGIGLLLHADINWATWTKIFLLGFGTPMAAMIFSFITYKIYAKISNLKPFLFIERFLGWAVLISGAFLAYTLGANNIGNAIGLVVGSGALKLTFACVIGGIAIGFGSITLGGRVMRTVGTGITELSAQTAFAAQAGSAFAVYMLTLFGIPTSTSFGIVGGVAGVGLVKGVDTLQRQTLKRIIAGWVFTPVISAFLAVIVYKLLGVFL